jgi:carbamoyltransferase
VRDGKLVFAIEDERITRIKHGRKFSPYRTYVPYDSIYAALESEGLVATDIDEIAYSYSKWIHFRAMWGVIAGRRPSSLGEEFAAFQSVSRVRSALVAAHELPHRYLDRLRAGAFRSATFREWDHHLAHAASTFFCSGFDRALVVVADGCGERACTSVYRGEGRKLKKLTDIALPHSLGFFYSFICDHIGFEQFSDEYKVMGLAAFGVDRFRNAMEQILILQPLGRYRIDTGKMNALSRLLGPVRASGEPLDQTHADIAHSAQRRLEQALMHIIRHHVRSTGIRRVCVAGGIFLNCVANGLIAGLDEIENYFVQPASHDAGTAIGAAALSAIRRGGAPRLEYESMFLGTSWNSDTIEKTLIEAGVKYVRLPRSEIAGRIAGLLAAERVVGLFQERMEFGPRALGHRSILASPKSIRMREKLNIMKGREQFRPLAPLVPTEAFDRFFEGKPNR